MTIDDAGLDRISDLCKSNVTCQVHRMGPRCWCDAVKLVPPLIAEVRRLKRGGVTLTLGDLEVLLDAIYGSLRFTEDGAPGIWRFDHATRQRIAQKVLDEMAAHSLKICIDGTEEAEKQP